MAVETDVDPKPEGIRITLHLKRETIGKLLTNGSWRGVLEEPYPDLREALRDNPDADLQVTRVEIHLAPEDS